MMNWWKKIWKWRKPLNQRTRIIEAMMNARTLRAKDIMTPYVDIASIDVHAGLEDAARLMVEKKVLGLVVYRGTPDTVIGVIDYQSLISGMVEQTTGLIGLVKKPLFAVPSISVFDLFLDMGQTNTRQAVIIDEHGEVDGVIQSDDILEHMFSEISKWRQAIAHNGETFIVEDEESYIVGARYRLKKIQQQLPGFPPCDGDEDVDTLGGFVFSLVGRIPAYGEVIRHKSGFEFEILDVDARRIHRLRIFPPRCKGVEVKRDHGGKDGADNQSKNQQ